MKLKFMTKLISTNPAKNYEVLGSKESGMGREHGKYGFQELTQIKVVSMEK